MARILVVDDELLIRDLLYDFFTSRDYDITLAESGAKALDLLEREQFDLVLSDLRMPGMDGLELATRIRAGRITTPIIIMTGFPSLDSAVQALRQKIADYIVKPFNMNRLLESIEGALNTAAPSGA